MDAELDKLKKQGVYQHVGKIITKVVSEKPSDPYKIVEVLSRLIKESPPAPEPVSFEAIKAQAEYLQKVQEAAKAPTEGEENAPAKLCGINSFMEESALLEWAGVGFGEATSYELVCAMRRLSAAKPMADGGITKMRFWGKILGVEADYWVVETQGSGGGEGGEGDAEGQEAIEAPGGAGVNQFKYFVTTDLSGEWLELPDAKPSEIVSARKIKKLFTGRLDAKVITHPYFAGKEARFLRAQIARITADTMLCPKGYLKKGGEEGDEDGTIEVDPEFKGLPPAELQSFDSWTHTQAHILRSGRTTHPEVPDEDEENEEVTAARAKVLATIAKEPAPDLLRSSATDGLRWGAPLVRGGGVTCLRSQTWPGAVSVVKDATFVNVYVGHGLVAGEPDFFFCAPLDIEDEPEDPPDEVVEEAEEEGGG